MSQLIRKGAPNAFKAEVRHDFLKWTQWVRKRSEYLDAGRAEIIRILPARIVKATIKTRFSMLKQSRMALRGPEGIPAYCQVARRHRDRWMGHCSDDALPAQIPQHLPILQSPGDIPSQP